MAKVLAGILLFFAALIIVMFLLFFIAPICLVILVGAWSFITGG